MDIRNIIKNRRIWIITLICLLVVICLLIIVCQLRPPQKNNEEETFFIIKQGQGLEEITANLKEQGLIRSKQIFVLYGWIKGKSKKIQAGTYSLNLSMSVSEIVKKIITGDVIIAGIKVTIPEGFSNKQIEKRLINLGIINHKEILPEELEGYLFPDTYYFEKDSFVEEIVKRMQDNFNKKITNELRIEIEKQGKSLDDILKIASLLEKEVKSDKDRAIVSGIFWQRLSDNYPLESCATIAYIMGVDRWRYSYEETRIKSLYNTYLNIGLPPTPINNPGISAIKAAIYPQETDYYFFLTAPDGKTIFSKTFREHSANERKYLESDVTDLILQ